MNPMTSWLTSYVADQHRALDSVPLAEIERLTKDSPVNGTSAPVFRLMSDS